jgi:hypothetical protein
MRCIYPTPVVAVGSKMVNGLVDTRRADAPDERITIFPRCRPACANNGPGHPGAVERPQRFPYVNRICMKLLYGRAGRLNIENGGSRPRAVCEAGCALDGPADTATACADE